MSEFRAALGGGLVLLDAAMGTRLIARGLRLDGGDDPCLWNLERPGDVLDVHRRDVAAGAGAVLTNTFGANRAWLGRFGRSMAMPSRTEPINRAAVLLARRAAGAPRFVLGDIGPTAADAGAAAEQAAILVDAGVDALLFETCRLDQAEAALEQVGRVKVPVLVSLLDWPDPPDAAVGRLIALGAEALGGNCQVGMAAALALAERLRAATPLPLIVKPAAGRACPDSPSAFAEHVSGLRALAPVLVGGCCGTTEAHLAALRAAW
jgi:methionine synthase I (cobalamin-dependent)